MPVKFGIGPLPKEAMAFFIAKKLKVGFSYKDIWKEEHNTAFTIAKVLELDVLDKVQSSLTSALEDGVPFKEWAKNIKGTFDQSGWTQYNKERGELSRLKIIYDTNTRQARAKGQWDRIERVKKVRPYLSYNLGPSANHRQEHVAWEGKILPVDDPFWDYATPMNGYG